MAIDYSIYMRNPGLVGNALSRGFNLGGQIRDNRLQEEREALQKQKQVAMQNAYNTGIITGQDGQVSFNPKRAALSLAGQGFQQEAVDLLQRQQADQAAMQKQQQQMAMQQEDQQLRRQNQAMKREQFNQNLALRKSELAQKMEAKRRKLNPTAEEKVASLGAEERKRFDNVRMGKNALNNMAMALAAGDNTFSPIGDNNFTIAASQWEEAIGRMQSGGAINNDEAKRFRNLVPSAWDSREIQAKKLKQMSQEMENRLGSLGFKSQDIEGFSNKDFKKAINQYVGNQPKKSGSYYGAGSMDSAVAQPNQILRTDQIDWAD